MPLPNILEFIGTNITQRKFQQAQEKFLNYVGVEVPTKNELSAVSASLNAKITPKADKTYVDAAVGAISTDASKQYATLALANADIANIPLNKNVFVSELANGGYWYKDNSSATSLIKSPYDSFEQAKNYTDQKVISNSATINILEVVDSHGTPTLIQTEKGELLLPGIDKSVQEEINDFKKLSELSTEDSIRVQLDSHGNVIEILHKNGHLYLPHLQSSVQDMLLILSKAESVADAITIFGNSYVGGMLTAVVKEGYEVDSYQWMRDGADIAGSNAYTYTLTSNDMGKYISCKPIGLRKTIGNAIYVAANPTTGGVGGVAIGESGTGFYSGYTLSFGDDFNNLDAISAANPLGKWFTTRTYLGGTRATDSWLQTQYEVDPFFTGYKDSNRGVPLDFGNMTVKNSILRMQCRNSNDFEKQHIEGQRKRVASLIDSIGACSWFAGDDSDGKVIVECKIRLTPTNKNFRGFHPSFWTQSSTPSIVYGSDEMDIIEGEYNRSEFNLVRWGSGGTFDSQVKAGSTTLLHDGEWHTLTAIMSKSRYDKYIDSVLVKAQSDSSNTKDKLQRIIASSHVAEFDIVESDWLVDIVGSNTYELDWVRIWRQSSRSHIKPLATVNPININHGDVGIITLPPTVDLWGRADLIEHVQAVMTEEIEPFGSARQAYNTFPTGVTYDSISRQITIDTTQSQKSGRLNFVIYGYLADGSTAEPARTYANVSPIINVDSISLSNGLSFDLYAACDCGVLVTDGKKCTKVIAVDNLPIGSFYNATTGYLQSISAMAGTYDVVVNCTNSVNQKTTKQVSLTIS